MIVPSLLLLLPKVLPYAPFIGLFMDYHRKDNIHRAIIFCGVFIGSIVLMQFLHDHFPRLLLLIAFASPFLVTATFVVKAKINVQRS